MNTSGDAAEQVVRLSLEGMEVAAKITGSAAKEVAALLYAALKNRDKNKIKGRQRLTSMLRSGKELTIFTVKNKDMARFVADAKRYGVVYCVLREAKDNTASVKSWYAPKMPPRSTALWRTSKSPRYPTPKSSVKTRKQDGIRIRMPPGRRLPNRSARKRVKTTGCWMK